MKSFWGSFCGWLLVFSCAAEGNGNLAKESVSQKQLSIKDSSRIRVPPSRPTSGGFQFEVSLGDRETRFIVWGSPEEKYYYAESNGGLRKKGYLSQKNHDFLIRKVNEMKPYKGVPVTICPRMKMTLILEGEKSDKTACLNLKNPLTQKMMDLSSVLSFLIM